MKPSQLLRASALLAAVTALPATLHAQCDRVWSTGWTNYTIGPSHLAATEDKEVADDFDFTGSSWSLATGLECIPGVSLLGLDGVGGELWAAGRQTSAGIVPLVAHNQVGGASPVSFYCAAKTNSLGCTPVLTSEGCACGFLAGAKSFTLRADNLLGAKNGLFFYGTNGPAQQPFQGGELCVKPPLKRLAVQSTGGTNGLCDGSLAVDFNQVIASGLDPQLQFGTQVAVQAWTRDPADPFKTNLTSARLFTIAP
ncbi:MAG: hypothetical protein HZA52_09000 [Planctomycetes bacterium]|nr:hypothetical protein [Planctomycetota bacterium]